MLIFCIDETTKFEGKPNQWMAEFCNSTDFDKLCCNELCPYRFNSFVVVFAALRSVQNRPSLGTNFDTFETLPRSDAVDEALCQCQHQ